MPLITSSSIIRTLSLFHLTTAYYLLIAPTTLAKQNLVIILGQSMRLPLPAGSAFDAPTHATALAAVLLAFLAVADFTAVALLPDEVSSYYWSSQAPVRVGFWMVICGWIYVWKPVAGGVLGSVKAAAAGASWGEEAKNSMVFSLGFVETAAWFWVFILLREERRLAGLKVQEKRRKEEQ